MSEDVKHNSGLIQQVRSVFSRLTREDLIALAPAISKKFNEVAKKGIYTDPEILRAFERAGLHVLFPHFYSIVPRLSNIPDYIWSGPWMQQAFNTIPAENTEAVLDEILGFSTELSQIPPTSEAQSGWDSGLSFCWHNGSFPPLDAITYYGLIRTKKPRRILEVGSGNSTKMALLAAEQNSCTQISVIEPYPMESLKALASRFEHVAFNKVEAAPLWLFDMLDSNDILFVDTSHVVNVGSEVNYIMFNILPRLRRGVMVHIHDIFLPYEYPKWWLDDRSMMWNEQYAWLAFLMGHRDFKLLIPVHAAGKTYERKLREDLKELAIWNRRPPHPNGPLFGTSLWIIKS
jgi:hypothetical protein